MFGKKVFSFLLHEGFSLIRSTGSIGSKGGVDVDVLLFCDGITCVVWNVNIVVACKTSQTQQGFVDIRLTG